MSKNLVDLDIKIIKLISERARLYVEDIKKLKDDSKDFYLPEDIKRVNNIIDSFNSGPLSNELLKKIFNDLISSTINLIQPLKVAYLGPPGTFTHIALLEIFGESVESVSQRTISDVFIEVENNRASLGVVPIENSTEGAVTYTLDDFLDTDLKIVSEKFLRISYWLLSHCTDMNLIEKLYSHPQPFAQCKVWIRENLPNAEIHQVNSTSQAAKIALSDGTSAAIASEASAKMYHLGVLANNIEDSRQNFTRFLVIGKRDNPSTGEDKTSIVCSVRDEPGALYKLLKVFSDEGINMTKIESRPDKKKIWEYIFFIDFIGHKDDESVKFVIDRIRKETLFLKIFGSYPVES